MEALAIEPVRDLPQGLLPAPLRGPSTAGEAPGDVLPASDGFVHLVEYPALTLRHGHAMGSCSLPEKRMMETNEVARGMSDVRTSPHGQVELERLPLTGLKAVTPIELHGAFVFGVDEDTRAAYRLGGPACTIDRICQQ